MTLDDVIADLDFLDDDLDRFQYVLDLGHVLPPFPAAARTEAHRVHGCTSQAWLVGTWNAEDPARLDLFIDADALFVRGLAAVLWLACNGRTAQELQAMDVGPLLKRLHLADQLTPGRQQGLAAMWQRIRDLATAPA